MLLLTPQQLDERKRVTRQGDMAALYGSLATELTPLIERDLYVPTQKALLSRVGGRCESDGTTLLFDPWSPEKHRCPTCGAVYTGELHHRAWIMHYQLWLAERAVHAALFFALRGESRHGQLARSILHTYVDRYLGYPNVDNVLGPGRLFFSTYLESIWLLQICVAVDLLRAAGDESVLQTVCDRIIEPSRATIAVFDEGMSNRQVWNNAALLAADTVLGDDRGFDARLFGNPSSLRAHLEQALLVDGTWYEGENYHQFALRGLWFGVTMAESRGVAIEPRLLARFQRAFESLYLTALPDFTMPSRKDSQYAVSLRQWRIAELAELGYARQPSSLLASTLARTYETGHERIDTGRSRSTAEAERNSRGGALTRADLGWRALLHAVPALPMTAPRALQSAILEGQGLSIFRRSPDVYVSLDYGTYGGGHGHPDRLNVTLSVGSNRILDDLGTGSYVDPSLHWYRSTLAHNAPLVNGQSQPDADGVILAHDERGALGWTAAAVEWPEQGVRVERALVVAPGYFVDELRWTADADVRIELPWHVGGACDLAFEPGRLDGQDGIEDGFAFVKEVEHAGLAAKAVAEIRNADHRLWLTSDGAAELFRGTAPGQPASRPRPFHVVRAHGHSGRLRAVVAWSDLSRVNLAVTGPEVTLADGSRHLHRRDDQGWHVEIFAMNARSSVDLAGFRSVSGHSTAPPPRVAATSISGTRTFELGEQHYRRSEERWAEAGSPTASVEMRKKGDVLQLSVNVHAREQRFAGVAAENAYDNEHPDTMGAGLQLYVRTATARGAWMLVPQLEGGVRVRAIAGWSGLGDVPSARWRETGTGYVVDIELPLAMDRFGLDLLINEAPRGRERRRGQLVLSGARGEFVYLRGDRHEESRLISFEFDS